VLLGKPATFDGRRVVLRRRRDVRRFLDTIVAAEHAALAA
jgi:hypothetical protein